MYRLSKALPQSMAAVSLLVCLLSAGCLNTVSVEKFQNTQRQLQLSQEENKRLERDLAESQQSVRTCQAQIRQLRGMTSEEAMAQLVTPVSLAFESRSGGYDEDGKPGDDGVILYVQPVDRDGHVIKAAGAMRVTLLDPLNPPNRNVVAEYNFDVPTTRKLWYGRLWTQHFSVRCPWPTGQIPIHDELTAHVVFEDLLTGRRLTAQQAFKVTLPPARTPKG